MGKEKWAGEVEDIQERKKARTFEKTDGVITGKEIFTRVGTV